MDTQINDSSIIDNYLERVDEVLTKEMLTNLDAFADLCNILLKDEKVRSVAISQSYFVKKDNG